MLVVGSEQLVGRQHTNILLLSFLLNLLNFCSLGLYTVMLAGLLETNTVKRGF